MILTTGQYDADTPDGDKGYQSQYITKKDAIRIGIVLVVLIILFIPVYRIMKSNGDKTVAKRNLRGAWFAMGIYSEGYDQRYPALFQEGENGAPYLENDMPVVWASQLSGLLPSGVDLKDSAADDSEVCRVNGTVLDTKSGPGKTEVDFIELTYGMYAPLATRPTSDVLNPSSTVLVAQTSNSGARGTFNPLPFRRSDGTVVPFDGFMVGWDTTNRDFYDIGALEDANSVTRLAFFDTEDGEFEGSNAEGRHGRSIYTIHVDGTLGEISSSDALIRKSGGRVTRHWSPD